VKSNGFDRKILILDNIRSAQNVGALFRTADAAGISEIHLIGISPTPLDKFNRPNSLIAKAALGAEQTIPWTYHKTIGRLLNSLRISSVQTIAIEQSDQAVDYKKIKPQSMVAFVVGNEIDGISKKTLSKIDIVAEIQMKGTKESLNVSVAAGIAIFRILNV